MICGYRNAMFGAFVLAGFVFYPTAQAETELNPPHQSPGSSDNARGELVQIIAREVEKSNVGLKIRVYPGNSLFKDKEQWGALTKSQLDIATYNHDFASGHTV